MSEDSAESLLMTGARVVLPDRAEENTGLLVEAGRIRRIGCDVTEGFDGRRLDLKGTTLFPGFMDLHIHGAVGVDTMEATSEGLHETARFLASQGVTAWLPTLVPGPNEDYARAVSAIEELMKGQDALPAAARTLGVHYEGPFVNEKQCGALRTEYFRTYSAPGDLAALPRVNVAGAKHLMTLAPEVEGGVELIRELCRKGWVASLGHTRASVEELDGALEAGARHLTHFPNAMPQLHHRSPGPVGWGLTHDELTCDVIADGVHCHPLMLKLILRCKGSDRVSLISDSVAPAGLGDGDYQLWGETIRVEGGRTSNARGSIAGSVITMLDAVRLVRGLDVSDVEVGCMASLNPARLLSIDAECGSIMEGKRADLVALDQDGRVRLTIVGGRVIER